MLNCFHETSQKIAVALENQANSSLDRFYLVIFILLMPIKLFSMSRVLIKIIALQMVKVKSWNE